MKFRPVAERTPRVSMRIESSCRFEVITTKHNSVHNVEFNGLKKANDAQIIENRMTHVISTQILMSIPEINNRDPLDVLSCRGY